MYWHGFMSILIHSIFVTKHNFHDRPLICMHFLFFLFSSLYSNDTVVIVPSWRAGCIVTTDGPKIELQGEWSRQWLVRQIKCKYLLTTCSLLWEYKERRSLPSGGNSECYSANATYLLLLLFFSLHCCLSTFLLVYRFHHILAGSSDVSTPQSNARICR